MAGLRMGGEVQRIWERKRGLAEDCHLGSSGTEREMMLEWVFDWAGTELLYNSQC